MKNKLITSIVSAGVLALVLSGCGDTEDAIANELLPQSSASYSETHSGSAVNTNTFEFVFDINLVATSSKQYGYVLSSTSARANTTVASGTVAPLVGAETKHVAALIDQTLTCTQENESDFTCNIGIGDFTLSPDLYLLRFTYENSELSYGAVLETITANGLQ